MKGKVIAFSLGVVLTTCGAYALSQPEINRLRLEVLTAAAKASKLNEANRVQAKLLGEEREVMQQYKRKTVNLEVELKQTHEQNRILAERVHSMENGRDSSIQVPIDSFKYISFTLRQGISRCQRPPVVHPDTVRILSITNTEKVALNRTLAKAWSEYIKNEIAGLKVTKSTKDTLSFTIAAFPEKGMHIKNSLLSRLEGIVGQKRMKAWNQMRLQNLESFDRLFNHFGQGPANVEMKFRDSYCQTQYEVQLPNGKKARQYHGYGKRGFMRYARFSPWMPDQLLKLLPPDKILPRKQETTAKPAPTKRTQEVEEVF